MSNLSEIALRMAVALLKEQAKHIDSCMHCSFLRKISGGDLMTVHEPQCPIIAASQLVQSYQAEIMHSGIEA